MLFFKTTTMIAFLPAVLGVNILLLVPYNNLFSFKACLKDIFFMKSPKFLTAPPSEKKKVKGQFQLCLELWRAKRARGAPWVSKSTHPRKFDNHVTVHRPSVRTTGIPMFTLTLSSYFGSPGESWLHINVDINWQLSKQGIRWPVSPNRIASSGVDPSRSSIFWSYPLTIYSYKTIAGSRLLFF